MCVQLAGRLYVGGESEDDELCVSVFSYDPRTDRWKSESPLPLADYGTGSLAGGLRAVAHEGRIIVIGIQAALPLALAGDVWTELPPLHPTRPEHTGYAYAASLRFE